ncbi:MAG: glycosyltransferase, partial [Pseudomonadota bacterium]
MSDTPATSDKPSVLVYRDKLLPSSEGFIPRHYTHLQEHRVIYAGARRVASGAAMLRDPDGTDGTDLGTVVNEGGSGGKRAELRYRLTGRSAVLDSLIQREKPKLIHAHFGKSGARVLPTAIANDVPLVVTFHGGDATKHGHFKPFWQTGEVFALRLEALKEQTALFIAVSGYVRDVLIGHGFPAERIVVHHIGIDT